MTRDPILRSIISMLIIVLGILQAWDSYVFSAGIWIILLVSFAIALPAVTLMIPLQRIYFIWSIALALILLGIARLIAPIPLLGLFLILVPSVMGLIFTGLARERNVIVKEKDFTL